MIRYLICICSWLSIIEAKGQQLQPGFDKQECIELLKIGAQVGDSGYRIKVPNPEYYTMIYRSPECGLQNRWDLWKHRQLNMAVISIRGTTGTAISWLGNFYAAMVSARGYLQLSATDTFHYELATDPKAAVHAGWLLATGFLSKTILAQIDSCYHHGIKQFIITGHSQGGAICYLLTSYLRNLQFHHQLPADIQFKTYCIAAPKPGNLYYAYEFEAQTQYGWAYNVVNSADWVPETPVSIQTLNDFNTINPFLHAKKIIGKLKFPKNLAVRHAYNRIYKPSRKVQRRYEKLLGVRIGKAVQKKLPGFVPPAYYHSSDYIRAGNIIVMQPDENYYKVFPNDPEQIFRHHHHQPYLYLALKLPDTQAGKAP